MEAAEKMGVATPRTGLLRDYAKLTKPGITTLVLVTTLVGFYAGAEAALADPLRLLHTMLGSALVVSGASVLNMVLERERDARMRRTRLRPIPDGRIPAEHAAAFGVALSIAGHAYLAFAVGVLTCAVAGISWILYVLVYTPLKPVSSLATILGAVPGALPPVIGWAAARGDLSAGAWILFSIMFLWQFPHFLALGWMYRADYERGGFPVLAVADPTGNMTRRQAFLYSAALLPVALLPALTGLAGRLYFVVALVLSFGYVLMASRCSGPQLDRRMRALFLYSIAYLPVMLAALAVERIATLVIRAAS